MRSKDQPFPENVMVESIFKNGIYITIPYFNYFVYYFFLLNYFFLYTIFFFILIVFLCYHFQPYLNNFTH